MSEDQGLEGARPRRRVVAVRPISVVVLVAVLCSAVVTSVVVRGVMADQERRLLRERAREAGVVVSSSLGSAGTTLGLTAALAHPASHGVESFRGAAELLVGAMQRGDRQAAMGAAQVDADGVRVLVGVGDGPVTGDVLVGDRGALIERAVATPGMVSDVFDEGSRSRLVFALATGREAPIVLYQETTFDRTQPLELDLFDELDGVLYVSSDADAENLLFSTVEDARLTGDPIDRRLVEVGADEWLMVTTPRRSLVGAFAEDFPTFVLVGGAVMALLVAALVEALSRRRAYALQLVDERTAALRSALVEQERLEDGQRRAREVAEEANRSKSEFLSRMSHELRTPLNAVLGFAQLLELDELDESQRESVHQILRGGRHLLDLINEVLDITRIESGDLRLSPEPVLVGDVLAEVIDLARPLADHGNVRMVANSGGAGWEEHVFADRQRLKQILLNLIANGIKYNRAGGTVSVSCERVDGGRLRLKVADTGPGIRPEHRELIFTPFERLGAEHTGVEGTGIGLALSKRLAESMDGTIDLATTFGKGTTFWVELPVVEGPVERYERLVPKDEPRRGAVAGPVRKVLYVEDNLSNLRLVERILGDMEGVELIASMQGQLGVELAREHQPALVLLDLHLPDIGGAEVLRQLRDDPATASIPVVVVSADATNGQVRRLLTAGATAYLTKPLEVSELLRLLEELMAVK
jgi:signal transduction histidine kinase/CheY-like chemotaxis protein